MAVKSDVAHSHQRGPNLWCGTADGVKYLILHSGSEPVLEHVLQIRCVRSKG